MKVLTRSGPRPNIYVRYIHEVLFSFNMSVASLSAILSTRLLKNYPLYIFNYVQFEIMHQFHVGFHSRGQLIAGYLAYFLVWILFVLLILLLLRVFARFSTATEVLRSMAGMTALLVSPLSWYYGYGSGCERSWQLKGAFEMTASAICGLLYLHGRWPLPRWASVLLLCAHFALWSWYFPYLYSSGGVILAFLGFVSSIAWGLYVSDQRSGEASEIPRY